MTAADPDLAALYAAILAHPDEDVPRLVYADYLDEQACERGEPIPTARAAFIRAQCEGATDSEVWLLTYELCFKTKEFAQLMPAEQYHSVTLAGGHPTRLNFDSRTSADRVTFVIQKGFPHRVEVPRLSDAVMYTLPSGELRATPWLAGVLTGHPTVREVVPQNREPFLCGTLWYWFEDDFGSHGDHGITSAIFDLLSGAPVPDNRRASAHKEYPDRAAARSALGRAVVALARGP